MVDGGRAGRNGDLTGWLRVAANEAAALTKGGALILAACRWAVRPCNGAVRQIGS